MKLNEQQQEQEVNIDDEGAGPSDNSLGQRSSSENMDIESHPTKVSLYRLYTNCVDMICYICACVSIN